MSPHWTTNIKKKHKLFAICGCVIIILVVILFVILKTTNYIIDNSISKSKPEYIEDSPEQENIQSIDLPDGSYFLN